MGRKSQQKMAVNKNAGINNRRKEKKSNYEKEQKQNGLLHLRKRKMHRLDVKQDTLAQRKINIQSRNKHLRKVRDDYDDCFWRSKAHTLLQSKDILLGSYTDQNMICGK